MSSTQPSPPSPPPNMTLPPITRQEWLNTKLPLFKHALACIPSGQNDMFYKFFNAESSNLALYYAQWVHELVSTKGGATTLQFLAAWDVTRATFTLTKSIIDALFSTLSSVALNDPHTLTLEQYQPLFQLLIQLLSQEDMRKAACDHIINKVTHTRPVAHQPLCHCIPGQLDLQIKEMGPIKEEYQWLQVCLSSFAPVPTMSFLDQLFAATSSSCDSSMDDIDCALDGSLPVAATIPTPEDPDHPTASTPFQSLLESKQGQLYLLGAFLVGKPVSQLDLARLWSGFHDEHDQDAAIPPLLCHFLKHFDQRSTPPMAMTTTSTSSTAADEHRVGPLSTPGPIRHQPTHLMPFHAHAYAPQPLYHQLQLLQLRNPTSDSTMHAKDQR